MKKKLLSLAIILAMAISLFPAKPLIASAEDVVHEYVFADKAAGNTAISSVSEYTDGSGQWKYFAGNVSKANRQQYKTGYTTYVQSKIGQWIAVKIKIDTPAVYSASLAYATGNSSSSAGVGKVYLLPGDTSDEEVERVLNTEAAKDLGTVKYAGSSNAMATAPQALENITVEDGEQGEYIVVFKATAARDGKTEDAAYMYLTNLTLTKIADVEVEEKEGHVFTYDLREDTLANGIVLDQSFTYAENCGLWQFETRYGATPETSSVGITSKASVGQWFAVRINVPVKDVYKVKLIHFQQKENQAGGKGEVYFLSGDAEITSESTFDTFEKLISAEVAYQDVEATSNTSVPTTLSDSTELNAGEYIVVFYAKANGDTNARMFPHIITLESLRGGNNPAYAGVVTVPSEIENGTTVTDAVKVWNTATGEKITDGITLSSSNTDVATVSGTTVTAVVAGDTTLTATCSAPAAGNIIGADVSVVPTAQEKADAAFNAAETTTQYNAPELTGLTIGGKVIDGVPNGDGSFNITAPAAKENGSKFLYWAKGLTTQKTILLYKTNELKNYFPGENGRELLIAVYEDELPSTTEYYNANGQLIPDATSTDTAYMAGYGKTSEWQRYGNTNIYVAKYNKEKPDNVTVTVVDGNGGGTVPYGDPVTCTADESNGTFRWWQKDVNGTQEIVSVDKEYSFLAYEDCMVTAVYGDSAVTVTNPAKIIIDTFGENSVMAEFIGFKNKTVLEKGIMFGEHRIAMTAPGNQFTVTADKNGTFKGYAIVENGDGGYTLITDGEATITIAE